ncbi:Putative uncharacterized protein [Moritella viscosa]|nr:Putative uncharacterized protein [Moritella viscosa]
MITAIKLLHMSNLNVYLKIGGNVNECIHKKRADFIDVGE